MNLTNRPDIRVAFTWLHGGHLACLTCLLLALLASTPARADEPPAYKDFMTLERLKPDSREWRELYEFLEKWMKLNDAQVKAVTQSSPARVNAIVAHAADKENELLSKALASGGDDPLVLASTVNFCFGEMHESRDVPPICSELDKIIASFQKADPDNSLPWYQMASLEFKRGDLRETLINLRKGNEIGRYQSYFIPLFKELRSLGKTLNYSPYLANIFAFQNAVNILWFSHLKDMCSRESVTKQTEALARPCAKMGEAIERHSMTILESMVGLSIQSNAYKAMGYDDNSEVLQGIGERRRSLFDLLDRMEAAKEKLEKRPKNVPEEEAVGFYSDLETHGEAEALKMTLGKLPR